jgi:hypothetical protein
MNPKNRPDICQGSIPKPSVVGHLITSGFKKKIEIKEPPVLII